jgi:hypothetical protein
MNSGTESTAFLCRIAEDASAAPTVFISFRDIARVTAVLIYQPSENEKNSFVTNQLTLPYHFFCNQKYRRAHQFFHSNELLIS